MVWLAELERTHAFSCDGLVLAGIVGIWREGCEFHLPGGACVPADCFFSSVRDGTAEYISHSALGKNAAGIQIDGRWIGTDGRRNTGGRLHSLQCRGFRRIGRGWR